MFVTFSPDSQYLVTVPGRTGDPTVRLWHTATGAPFGTPLKHGQASRVDFAAFSPDNRHVVTAFLGGVQGSIVQIWDAASGTPVGAPLMNGRFVNAVAFSEDGAMVLSRCHDDTVGLWDAATGARIGLPLPVELWVLGAGERIGEPACDMSGSSDAAAVRRFLATSVRNHQGLGNGDGGYSPDCTRIVGPGKDVYAYMWDVFTGCKIEPDFRHDDEVRTAYFSPSGRRVITASEDGTARIWDPLTGERLIAPLRHGGCVRSASFSPDESLVVTVGDDGCARLWNSETGDPLGPILRHESVRDAIFSPDGMRVATWGWDWGQPSTAQLWDVTSRAPIGAPITSPEVRP